MNLKGVQQNRISSLNTHQLLFREAEVPCVENSSSNYHLQSRVTSETNLALSEDQITSVVC
jgi:hypothetical protein